MHELSIAQRIIEIIEAEAEKNGIAKVRRARLKVGKMAAFQREQLEFCLMSYEKGDALKGMVFDIEEISVKLECAKCKKIFDDGRFSDAEFAHEIAHAPLLYSPPNCPECGCVESEIVSGREMEIVEIEG